MPTNPKEPVTLGDKLTPETFVAFPNATTQASKPRIALWRVLLGAFCIGLLVWFAANDPISSIVAALGAGALLVLFQSRKGKPSARRGSKPHMLLAADKQGFMKNLKLADKTALFDGNNIFHFGIENGIGATALWALTNSLRSEGYRIVCFFDANIFFTLQENDELQNQRGRFSVTMLKEMFDLQPDEIYVVPSGSQADAYIIETLAALPISFVVTNDRFRDYQGARTFLGKDTQWRKGVEVKDGELRLFQHKFKRGLKV